MIIRRRIKKSFGIKEDGKEEEEEVKKKKEQDKEKEEKSLTVNSEVDVLRAIEEPVREVERVASTVVLTKPPQQQTRLRPATKNST